MTGRHGAPSGTLSLGGFSGCNALVTLEICIALSAVCRVNQKFPGVFIALISMGIYS